MTAICASLRPAHDAWDILGGNYQCEGPEAIAW